MDISTPRQMTILIVDDNITNLKVAMRYLKAYSFNILTARDGEAGIERAILAKPDLILLDVQMPKLDGFEACRRLRANPATSGIPVILMTVLSESSYKVRGLEAGAVDYVTKPIDEAELLARINTHLRLRQLQEQLQLSNESLEERVRERTAALEEEMTRRQRYQEEKEGLLELVRQQSEQLRQLTQIILEDQEHQQGRLQSSQQQIERDLAVLESQIGYVRQLLADRAPLPETIALAQDSLASSSELISRARQRSEQIERDLHEAASAQHNARNNPLLKLSDREYEIFRLLAQGKSNSEITRMLYLAKTTVSTYQRRIMEKLGIEDPSELARFIQE